MVENLKTTYNAKVMKIIKEKTNKTKIKKLTKEQTLKISIKKLKIGTIALIVIGITLYATSSISFKYAVELNQTSNLTELITLVPSYLSGMLIGVSGFTIHLKDKKKHELEETKKNNK